MHPDGTDPGSGPSHGGGTLRSAGLLLFTAAAGAGLLSYPFAALHQGVLLNVLLTLLFAANNVFTDYVLIQSAALFAPHLVAGTFEELSFRALGRRAYVLTTAMVVLGVYGGLIGFLIVIGDMIVPVAEHLCGGRVSALTLRPAVIMLFAVFVALPLSSIKRLHGLAWSSVVAGGSVLAVGMLVVARGAHRFESVEAVTYASPAPTDAPGAADAPLVLARMNLFGLALGVPISIFSLGNHCQVIPCFVELAPPLQRRFAAPLLTAVCSCWLLYCLTGACGYAAFRDATLGDVLLNFGVDDAASDAAKALLGIHIVLAYPVLLWPARKSIATLLLALSVSGEGGAARGGLRARVAAGLAGSPLAQSALLVLTSAAFAVGAPQVVVVFGLLGSTTAAYEIFLLPGYLLLKWSHAWRDGSAETHAGADGDGTSLLAEAEAATATLETGYDPYGDKWSDADARRVWASAAKRERGGELTVSVLSRSPALLCAQGLALIVVGSVIMVGSTSVYIYTTWVSPG